MAFTFGGETLGRADARVVDVSRSTSIGASNAARLTTVEHLAAAFGGLSIHEGVEVRVDGPEMPLLDGAARRWCDALTAMGLRRTPPLLAIVRAETVAVGESRYVFEPGDRTEIEVEVDWGDPRITRAARWQGDARDFAERIAPARTFGFEHEVADLLSRGLASHVAPESVVVIGPDRILCAGVPFTADEPARHKLLDLIGDLWLHGGPPRGRVHAKRPGHAATHAAMEAARERGIVRASA